MRLNVKDAQKGNIIFLIKKYGSQKKLANALEGKLSQQRISVIKQKGTSDLEARRIEQILVIPTGWMDKESLMQKYWEPMMKRSKYKKEEKITANSGSIFVLEHLSVGESLNI